MVAVITGATEGGAENHKSSLSSRPVAYTTASECSTPTFRSPRPRQKDARVRVLRRVFTQSELQKSYITPKKKLWSSYIKPSIPSGSSVLSLWTRFFSLFPILTWLPNYKWKTDLSQDMIAGFTVAVMHIPQGMGYAMLAGLPPITGIYMAFFPVIVYALMGTSRHLSLGTFAVIQIMTGKAVDQLSVQYLPDLVNATLAAGSHSNDHDESVMWAKVMIATAISFGVGLVQLIMGFFHMGSLAVVFSDVLVSAFTTGAAVHVLTSQIKYLFGLKVPVLRGPLKIVYTYVFMISHLFDSNVVAVIVSAITIGILMFNNEVLKPVVAKVSRVPVPAELIVVVLGTIFSFYGELNSRYGIKIVGPIPTGFPNPQTPPIYVLSDGVVSCIVIAVVAFATSLSMGKVLAKKEYSLDANQELIACGSATVFGSFFSCAPPGSSLSRSIIQANVGGRTQFASLFSAFLLIFVLLFIGPIFEPLPICVLSSIIVVALKGLLRQVSHLPKIAKISRADGLIWIVTLLSVVLIGIDWGLVIGIGVSLINLLYKGQNVYTCLLGQLFPGTGIFVDIKRYKEAKQLSGIKIYSFSAGLHFANREKFHLDIVKQTGLEEMLARRKQKKMKKKLLRAMKEKLQLRLRKGHNRQEGNNKGMAYTNPIDVTEGENLPASEPVTPVPPTPNLVESPDLKRLDAHIHSSDDFKYLIIDLSAVGFIDSAGVEVLAVVQKEFLDAGVLVFFAAARDPLLRMFVKTQFHDKVPENLFFPTIFDAVTHCLEQQCGEEFLDNMSSEDEEGLQFTTSSVGQALSERVSIRIMNDIEDKEMEVSAVPDQHNTETVELKEMPLQSSSSASSSSSGGTQMTVTQASVCPSSEEHVKTSTRVTFDDKDDKSGSK